MEVIFWCPSEKKTVGSIECKPGEVINAAVLKLRLKAEGKNKELKEARDRAPLICQACGTGLLVGSADMTLEELQKDNFRPLLGTFAAGK